MRGHEEASGTKYVPKALLSEWAAKDPILNYVNYLFKERLLTEKEDAKIKVDISKEINENLKKAFDEVAIESNSTTELNDVYKSFVYQEVKSKIKLKRFVLLMLFLMVYVNL